MMWLISVWSTVDFNQVGPRPTSIATVSSKRLETLNTDTRVIVHKDFLSRQEQQ